MSIKDVISAEKISFSVKLFEIEENELRNVTLLRDTCIRRFLWLLIRNQNKLLSKVYPRYNKKEGKGENSDARLEFYITMRKIQVEETNMTQLELQYDPI